MQSTHWSELGGGVEHAAASQLGIAMNSQHIYLSLLSDLIHVKSVADIGCAAGYWLRAALDMGISDVWGYDVTEMAPEERLFPSDRFTYVDLRQPLSSGPRKFDLAVSTEVAEHIPRQDAATFVRNLVQFSDYILFGAAVPYQGGVGHCNENWAEYWNILFRENGFVCFDFLRSVLWHRPDVHYYYRQNSFLYVSAFEAPSLINKGLTPTEKPLSLIHPEMLIQAVNRAVPPQQRTFGRDASHYHKVSVATNQAQLLEQIHDYGPEDLWFNNLTSESLFPNK
jgi:hypothetical protein